LWVICTKLVAVFKITVNGGMETVKRLLGKTGILISDRAKVFWFWSMNRRQVCWAHLIRKFASFAEFGGTEGRILSAGLLEQAELMFEWWHRIRDGTLKRSTFRKYMVDVRERVRTLLCLGAIGGVKGIAGPCADILEHAEALWTFVDVEGVEPTNNRAERDVRHGVVWRKNCFGTQSSRGNRFAERIMTVVLTLRKQKRNVLDYLTTACQNALAGKPAPSILPAASR
jgi:transposase